MNLKAKNNIKRKKEIKERTPPTDQLRKQKNLKIGYQW